MKINLNALFSKNPLELNVARNHFERFNDDDIIENFEIHTIDDNVFMLFGDVIFNNKVYTTTLKFDNLRCSINCDCPSYENKPCIHAALLALYYTKNYHDTTTSFPLSENTINQRASFARYLINMKQKVEQANTINYLNHKIHIIASIDEMLNDLRISFTLGETKMYVIKNMLTFLELIKTQQAHTYGKDLDFVHLLENFDEDSQALIKMLNTINYANNYDARYIYVRAENVDILYNTFVNHPSTCSSTFEKEELTSFAIDIKYERETFYKFSLKTPNLVHSFDYFYLFNPTKVFRFTAKASKTCFDLVKQLSQKTFIDVHKDDMEAFCTFFIEDALPYLDVDMNLIYPFLKKQLFIKTYIDLDDYNNLIITPSCHLANDNDENTTYILRDHFEHNRKTKNLLLLLNLFEATINNEYHHASIDCNSSCFDTFLIDGVTQLKNLGEVYICNALKNINHPTALNFNIGVHYEHDLLKLDISSIKFEKNELTKVLNAYKKKKKFHRLKNGEMINLESSPDLDELNDLLTMLNISDKALVDGEVALDKYRFFALENLAKENRNYMIERSTEFNALIKNVKEAKFQTYEIPAHLKTILRDYQVEGYNWLRVMSDYGFGAILADDMGLGKTLQIIALLNHKPALTCIVVCPTSLVLNWESEINKFSPNLSCISIYGNSILRLNKLQERGDSQVVIISYDSLRNDIEHYQDLYFDYIILDEAQYIKNQATKNAKAVKALQGKQRFALSGTPIENSLAELWSIFDFLMPHYLYNYNYFKMHFERDIIKYNDQKKQKQLKEMVDPFILRRTKKEVLSELPPKIETTITLQFEEDEKKIYLANLAQANLELQAKLNVETDNKMIILALLTRLRQLCCDRRIVYDGIANISSKMSGCLELIENAIANKQQILLFSSFVSVIDLLKLELKSRNISFNTITGMTSKMDRANNVADFQNNKFDVFLISLKAGGTGLNLTAAEVVIHFDPWWNISAQNQATDRAYRIGQDKQVQVYKLIMKDSIEERILELQIKKQVLSEAFVTSNQASIASMSKEEILALFSVKENLKF